MSARLAKTKKRFAVIESVHGSYQHRNSRRIYHERVVSGPRWRPRFDAYNADGVPDLFCASEPWSLPWRTPMADSSCPLTVCGGCLVPTSRILAPVLTAVQAVIIADIRSTTPGESIALLTAVSASLGYYRSTLSPTSPRTTSNRSLARWVSNLSEPHAFELRRESAFALLFGGELTDMFLFCHAGIMTREPFARNPLSSAHGRRIRPFVAIAVLPGFPPGLLYLVPAVQLHFPQPPGHAGISFDASMTSLTWRDLVRWSIERYDPDRHGYFDAPSAGYVSRVYYLYVPWWFGLALWSIVMLGVWWNPRQRAAAFPVESPPDTK